MHIDRLFEIVYLLMNKKCVTAKELADRFEVSVRTIYRDIDTLSGAGIPVYMKKGKGGGISILPGFTFDKSVMTQEDQNEILASLQAMNEVGLEKNTSTLSKLKLLMGNKQTDWIEVDFSSWADGVKEKEQFSLLKNAILQKRIVEFDYASVKGEEMKRNVEPLKLVYKGYAWYLYGFCRLRDDFRYFRLKRIQKLIVTELTFQREYTNTDSQTENSADSVHGDNKDSNYDIYSNYDNDSIDAELRIAPSMAYQVYDLFNDYKRMEDGSFYVKASYSDKKWLKQDVLKFGSACEILSPKELRLEIKAELKEIMSFYEKED